MTSCIDRIDKWHIMSETVQYSQNQSTKSGEGPRYKSESPQA